MLKQSFNKRLCFCKKKLVHFSYFCWQLTCIDLLSLQDCFLLSSHSCKTLYSTKYLCLLMEEHSVWFSPVLLFFHRLLELCMYELWLPSNKILFSWYIFKAFLSLSILVLVEEFCCIKKCLSLSLLLSGDTCFTFEKTVWTFLFTDKQFKSWYSHEHQFLRRNVYIERKLFMVFWLNYYVFPSISVTKQILIKIM